MLITTTAEDFGHRGKDNAKAERRRRKQMERSAEDRTLDPWERYRTLNDRCKMLLDLAEIYDRRSRFALLILGGLNAINLLLVARGEIPTVWQRGDLLMGAYVACYALLSLWVLAYAISVLKPTAPQSSTADGSLPTRQHTGLYLTETLHADSLDEYCQRWRDAQIGQINRELSGIAYGRSLTNAVKLGALDRVYLGLYILAGLTVAFFVSLAFSSALSA